MKVQRQSRTAGTDCAAAATAAGTMEAAHPNAPQISRGLRPTMSTSSSPEQQWWGSTDPSQWAADVCMSKTTPAWLTVVERFKEFTYPHQH
jgi:hypothetical protein